ncbi:hypothetical protein GCM10017653_27190 [Ancylobacter defluvii]|uniref:Uncharacterized protein n=1 Tax=Ancylobacter defluvii TaxID=1282440 RepID=A0A9W6JZA5_9HYPH|nr:hypothetical protein GCM10017653_27190 [Ancylobacter defluvii]
MPVVASSALAGALSPATVTVGSSSVELGVEAACWACASINGIADIVIARPVVKAAPDTDGLSVFIFVIRPTPGEHVNISR